MMTSFVGTEVDAVKEIKMLFNCTFLRTSIVGITNVSSIQEKLQVMFQLSCLLLTFPS